MKKILYLVTIFCAVALISCDDYLDLQSPDQLTSGTFWRDQNDAEAGLASAYSQLEYSINRWEFPEVKWPVEAYREDVVILGADAYNYPNWVELATFSYTNGNSQFTSYWWNNYRGISFANQVVEKVAEMPDNAIDPTIRTQIVNEAHFLRGYYHIKLLLNWKEIIIRDKYITNQAELEKGLSSRSDAWEFIIQEFKTATALPSSHNTDNLGRATSGAANAYLGFTYLTRAYEETSKKEEYLTEAVKAFDAVKGYELEKDFLSMFNSTNKNSKESIFELQLTMNAANGAAYQTSLHKWIGTEDLKGWEEILPSPMLLNEFMKEGEIASTGFYDSRLYHSIFYKCDYFNDPEAKRVYGDTYDNFFVIKPIPVFRKFLPSRFEELIPNFSAINIPLMRYANVLLMKAEALNELGRTSEAIPLINQVRSVHGDMPAMTGTTKEEVKAQIEHERIIEFPLENFRWYDLRRWGKTKEALTAVGRGENFKENEHSFYPVPLSELNANSQIGK
ncbi:RagB/SusD family nutrient uptake outer membrane protein [Bacteroides sp. 519]|uniref:RagB/SusD family nutrient uptake outer membrane protein n=1 Tax=Bacteroides sp. 519 TaxID=2302937 RepID=UPI0013D613DB|nr:RagB/SusD family nutrient uptake outer membrane protein [Bacteroides sp. 519]NDV59014.1 RagB/SusD family nutrient uptake outer membrane protein [Bacteroides sp. 519]